MIAIITLILTTLTIILSGYCKAVADTLIHHFKTSTFSTKPELFWNPEVSWKRKWKNGVDESGGRNYPKWADGFTDAWHIYNNSAFYLLIVGLATSAFSYHIFDNAILDIALKAVVGITLHMQIFNVFYSHIFKKKI